MQNNEKLRVVGFPAPGVGSVILFQPGQSRPRERAECRRAAPTRQQLRGPTRWGPPLKGGMVNPPLIDRACRPGAADLFLSIFSNFYKIEKWSVLAFSVEMKI